MAKKQNTNLGNLINKFVYVLFGALIFYVLTTIPAFKNIIYTSRNTNEVLSPTVKPLCDETSVIQNAKKSVVRIIGTEAEGTGFLFKKGYVLTNYHVVQGEQSVSVVFEDQTRTKGTIYNWDENADLAVVKVDSSDIPPLTFGDSGNLTPGQTVIGIGYPLGQALRGDATVTKGSYSARRQSDIAGVEFIQIDASLNEGNSGSPILNSCGKVVGVLTLTIKGTEGLKFAISSKTAKSLSESLISSGQKQPKTYSTTNSNLTTVNTTVLFYNYISTRQIDKAYELLSNGFKEREAGSKENFLKGYDTTLNVYLLDAKGDDQDESVVHVEIAAADLVGDKVLFRKFSGTWNLILEDGIWKLDYANISEVQ